MLAEWVYPDGMFLDDVKQGGNPMPSRLLKEIIPISFRQRLNPAVTCFVRDLALQELKEQFIDLS